MTSVARIGVLVPTGNPTVEREFRRMAPSSVTVHFARFDSPGGTPGAHVGMEQRLLDYLETIPTVIPSLVAEHPTVVVLAHTSVSYAIGFKEEPAFVERIAKLAGCPVVTASRAILAAFERFGVRRIALATPYSEAVEALGAAYWKAAGLEIVTRRRTGGRHQPLR
jgi:maleate cis-trans isomerase